MFSLFFILRGKWLGCASTAKEGDKIDISFQVLRGNGYYMYSVGLDKEPGLRDLGETYRLTLGQHQVRARAAAPSASSCGAPLYREFSGFVSRFRV